MPHKDKEKYNEYMKDYMLRRYHTRRKEALQRLGSRCVRCESVDNLEFDHIDKSTKSFAIGKLWSVSETKFLAELEKCQILCHTCHVLKTRENWEFLQPEAQHGTYWRYRKYKCRCADCTIANSSYNKERKQKYKTK